MQETGAEIVSSNLTDKKSLEKAIHGCSAVFHVAAPFKMHAQDMQKEIYETTLQGTQNILDVVLSEKIKKIIYTSSVGCLGSSLKGEASRTEKDWVQKPELMYIKAKTGAEKLFHDFILKNKIQGIATLPSTMIGPEFYAPNPSTDLFIKLVQGQLPAILPIHFDYVDVRDVAKGHVDLFEKENISSRYILSGQGYYLKDVVEIIHKQFPDLKLPTTILPNALLPIAVFSDWLEDKMKHSGRMLTNEVLKEFAGGKIQNFSSAKAQKEIGWSPRPVEESLRDTIEWIKNHYLIKKRSDKGQAVA